MFMVYCRKPGGKCFRPVDFSDIQRGGNQLLICSNLAYGTRFAMREKAETLADLSGQYFEGEFQARPIRAAKAVRV